MYIINTCVCALCVYMFVCFVYARVHMYTMLCFVCVSCVYICDSPGDILYIVQCPCQSHNPIHSRHQRTAEECTTVSLYCKVSWIYVVLRINCIAYNQILRSFAS